MKKPWLLGFAVVALAVCVLLVVWLGGSFNLGTVRAHQALSNIVLLGALHPDLRPGSHPRISPVPRVRQTVYRPPEQSAGFPYSDQAGARGPGPQLRPGLLPRALQLSGPEPQPRPTGSRIPCSSRWTCSSRPPPCWSARCRMRPPRRRHCSRPSPKSARHWPDRRVPGFLERFAREQDADSAVVLAPTAIPCSTSGIPRKQRGPAPYAPALPWWMPATLGYVDLVFAHAVGCGGPGIQHPEIQQPRGSSCGRASRTPASFTPW